MKALKSTVIYFIGTIVEKGLAFLLIPLYTHYLSTTDYGILTIVQSMIAMAIIIFSLSLSGSASRFHFDGKEFYKKFHYGNIFLLVSFFSFFGSLLLLVFKEKIFNLVGGIPIYPYIYFIIIISYGNIIFSLYQLMLRMEYKAYEFVKNNLIKFIFTTILSIYFVVYLHKKVEGILLASVIVFLIYILYIFFKLIKRGIKFNTNERLTKKNLSYSIYLVPHNLAGILNTILDRFYISNMIDLSNAGVYALAGQLAGIISLFASIIDNSLTPNILKAYKDKNYPYLKNLANITIIFVTIIALGLSLFSPEIIYLIAPKEYENAKLIIPILSFYAVVQMYYFMTSGVLFYEKKATKFVAVATVTSLLLNFIFNYFFIKFFGVKGAAIATLLSIIIVNYFSIFIGNKFIKVGFEHKKIHFVIISGFLVANYCYDFHILTKIIALSILLFIFLYIEKNNILFKSLKIYYKN
jgi:O-antigen/teichoic acid export membrane protein